MILLQLDEMMRECLQNCTDCHYVCLRTAVSGDVVGKISAEDLKLLLNCAEMCRTSADFIDTESAFHKKTCGLCSEICEASAAMCERSNIEIMRQCAQTCRKSADSCRRMAQG